VNDDATTARCSDSNGNNRASRHSTGSCSQNATQAHYPATTRRACLRVRCRWPRPVKCWRERQLSPPSAAQPSAPIDVSMRSFRDMTMNCYSKLVTPWLCIACALIIGVKVSWSGFGKFCGVNSKCEDF
jgi:hypothetical protein